ncbi:MAG: 3-hydroxyacyl-CoA dehydrogenase NAD-binding domain-containing protein [Rhodovibrionaceae bacterium]
MSDGTSGARPAPHHVGRVAVIGCGTIGASWAATFLAHGIEVAAWDPAHDGEAKLNSFIEKAWSALESLGLSAKADPTRLIYADSPAAACRGADFVQESAPERLDVKRELYPEIEAGAAPEAVLASSTSGLLISAIQKGARHPGRFVLGHPFNPPHLIPLVEVLGGQESDPAAVDWAMAFYASLGKAPIRIAREVPGHVANRLQAAMWREAVHLVVEGVATAADVDTAISQGPGLRWALMGPHRTFHLAGGPGGMANFLEHLGPATESWWDDLGSPRLTPEVKRALLESVEAENAGRSVAELAAERDRRLLALLTALKRAEKDDD